MATNSEAQLAGVQAATGTSLGWTGDWGTLFDNASIAASNFDGRLLAWINVKLGSSYTNVMGAQNAYALARGYAGWSQMGLFFPSATLDLNFTNASYIGAATTDFTVTRSGAATDLTYDQVASVSYQTFGANTIRVDSTTRGLLIEEARTNNLLNSDAPATQTTASLGTGSYTLWVHGTGSAAVSAGSATITGAGTAVAGIPTTFAVTVAGTVTITVTGTLSRFQLEGGLFPTSYIPTAGATVTRGAESCIVSGAPFAAFYTGGASGTLFTEAVSFDAGGVNNNVVAALDDNTSANRIQNRRNTVNGSVALTVTASSVVESTGTTGSAQLNAVFRMAHAFAASDQRAATNGSLNVGGTGASPGAAVTQLQLGLGTAAQALNGFVRRVAYIPARVTNAGLQGLTRS